MDDVFAPFPAPAGLDAPSGAEVVYLRAALLVLQGRYFDPGQGVDRPLPPHRFVLVARGTEVVAEGTVSDAEGISTIFDVDRSAVPEGTRWELALVPVVRDCDDGELAAAYSQQREIWIDVQRGAWVSAGFRDDTPGLLRIPLWSTRIKAERGGGFLQPYEPDPGFADSGTIADDALEPSGSHDRPWVLQIDHGWLRTWVQFHGYDPLRATDGALGVPLMLRSRVPGLLGYAAMRGGSSVMDEHGSIGIVHAGTAETLDGLSYVLFGSERPWVSLQTGARTDNPYPDLRLLESHYPLPSLWCSYGVEAWIGPKPADARARRPFGVLRHLGTDPAHPICFHLDDVVLCDAAAQPLAGVPAARVCVLDHRLAIRDQARAGDDPLPYSTPRLESVLLRAEAFVFVRGKGMDHVTRVLEIAGVLYSVDTARSSAPHARQDDDDEVHPEWCVGLRAAVPMTAACAAAKPDPTSAVMRQHAAYLVDASAVEVTFAQKKGRLFHWLLYLPCHVRPRYAERTDPKAVAALPLVEAMLFAAAQRWDQAHPAHPGAGGKNYALVGDGGGNEPPVVRVRHHFGAWEQPEHGAVLHDDVRPQPQVLPVQVVPRAGRASCGYGRIELFLAYADSERALHFWETDELRPAATAGLADPFDGTAATRFVLAHELGHAIGLDDEYLEPRDQLPLCVSRGRVQRSAFVFDEVSMMNGNCVPRLRHLFRRYEELRVARAADVVAAVSREPLELRDWGGPHPLHWPIEGNSDHGGATRLIVPIRVGRCDVLLLALGDDESSRGAMIGLPSPRDEAFDAVMVVRAKFEFILPKNRTRAAIASTVYDRFARAFIAVDRAPKLMVRGGAGARRRRVLLLFQPLFAIGDDPVPPGGVDLVVDLQHDGPAEEHRTPHSVPVLRVARCELGTWIMRHLLHPEIPLALLSREPFGQADVAPLVALLEREHVIASPVVEVLA